MKQTFKKSTTTLLPASLTTALLTEKDARFNLRYSLKGGRKTLRSQKREGKRLERREFHERKNTGSKGRGSNIETGLMTIPSSTPDMTKATKKQKQNSENPLSISFKAQKKFKEQAKETRDSKNLQRFSIQNPELFESLTASNLIPLKDLRKSGLQAAKKMDREDGEIDMLSKRLKLKQGRLDEGFRRDGLDYLMEGISKDVEDEDESEEENDELLDAIVDGFTDENNEVIQEALLEEDYETSEGEDDYNMEIEYSTEEIPDDSLARDEFILNRSGLTESNNSDEINTDVKKYVPPHQRKTIVTSEYSLLKRSLQGLINRLGDPNMSKILESIQLNLLTSPRHDVTEIITDIILTTVSDHSNLLDSFSLTYSCFIGCLYQLIGNGFGAHFVQTLVGRFQSSRLAGDGSKECTNLITLLSFLYTFNVISCVLIYDVIRQSIESLNEIDVEVLLRILRICGAQMRSDDPTSLKDIISKIHEEVAKRDKTSLR